MPVMNGRDATKMLRSMHKNGKISLTGTKIYMHSAI